MDILTKKCSNCGISKDLDLFYKQKTGLLGRKSNCIEYDKIKSSKWRDENKNYFKTYRLNNKEEKERKLYSKIEPRKINLDSYYYKNKERVDKYNKIYYQNNKDKAKEYNKNWREKNSEKWKSYSRNRYKKNLELATIKWMRNFLYRTEKQGFKKYNINTLTEFGYTPKQLIQRIEVQFKIGMSWSNRKEWHIDHKKPISSFKEDTSPKIINILSNLQPLWSKENLSKGYKF